MKHFFFTICILFFIQEGTSQCAEDVMDFGNNTAIPAYNITGDVMVTLNADGETITLDLASNFETAPGPDIRVFLVNSEGLSDTELANTLIADLEYFHFGLVGSDAVNQNGEKSFTVDIPAGVNISDFDTVFFYCQAFDQFWDFGKYISFTEATCSVLSVQNETLAGLTISPNPAVTQTTISNPNNIPLEIQIFNVAGNLIKQVNISATETSKTIDVSSLQSGIYFLEIMAEGKRKVQRLLKK